MRYGSYTAARLLRGSPSFTLSTTTSRAHISEGGFLVRKKA